MEKMEQDRINELHGMIEDVVTHFIQDELFSWGWWDGEEGIGDDDLKFMSEHFTVKATVEYTGGD